MSDKDDAEYKYKFHPLADLVPPMTAEEYDTLVADIKANGLRHPIILFEGKILDGRHRYKACIEAGVKPRTVDGDKYFGIDDPAAYVISANIHRRQLTREQKRDLILKCADWSKSDRTIAAEMKTNKNTVGRLRKQATVPTGTVEKRIGKDGKARKQPAKKKVSSAQYEKDKQECIELARKVQAAERERDQAGANAPESAANASLEEIGDIALPGLDDFHDDDEFLDPNTGKLVPVDLEADAAGRTRAYFFHARESIFAAQEQKTNIDSLDKTEEMIDAAKQVVSLWSELLKQMDAEAWTALLRALVDGGVDQQKNAKAKADKYGLAEEEPASS